MTWEIAVVLAILAASLVMFVSEKLRMDVVALLVLSILGILGVSGFLDLSLDDTLAGFSNPAVVTVWAMFILSAGLSTTGVADLIGRQVLKIAGKTEPQIILTIMVTTGVLSAFMNNIGVAALMLPVVMDIARRTQTSPSRLLMPMAYASLLGGLTTLVGTPPNLVASNTLAEAGHGEFSLFEFAPIGVPALVVGSLFVAFIGRHLLPKEMPESMRDSQREAGAELRFATGLEEFRFRLRVGADSPFHDLPLAETGLGQALGLNVTQVQRGADIIQNISGDFVVKSGDLLHVQGQSAEFRDFVHWRAFEMASGAEIASLLALQKLVLVSTYVSENSELSGLEVRETDFARRFEAHILTIKQGDQILRGADIRSHRFEVGDRIQVEMKKEALTAFEESGQFEKIQLLSEESLADIYPESEQLLELHIPGDSRLSGLTIAQSGIADLGLRIVGIARRGGNVLFPVGDEKFKRADKLLVHGTRENIARMHGLQSLELVETDAGDAPGLTADSGYAEATLSPNSTLVGRTPRELGFRRRYGLQVLSIWRQGRSFGSHVGNVKLEFGDALLVSGFRERIEALANDDDFLILSRSAYSATDRTPKWKTALAGGIMLAVVLSVLIGWLPIAIAAVAGGTIMIAARCLSIQDAYRAIEWKSVFLIACMIPLGTAMQNSGAASWLGEGVAWAASPFGAWGLIIGLYLMTTLATTIVPTTALVVIMAAIAMDASAKFSGVDERMIVMAIAMAASASFTSPISHPANVLVMGPGGYRFIDYVRMGLVLAAVVMLTILPCLWLFW